MPGFMVEFEFPDGAAIPADDPGFSRAMAHDSGAEGVAWVHLYATVDRRKSYCLYQAPSAEAIHRIARNKGLVVGAITQVRTLRPVARFDRVA